MKSYNVEKCYTMIDIFILALMKLLKSSKIKKEYKNDGLYAMLYIVQFLPVVHLSSGFGIAHGLHWPQVLLQDFG